MCENCGRVVDDNDICEGTLICFWCYTAYAVWHPFVKPFTRTKVVKKR